MMLVVYHRATLSGYRLAENLARIIRTREQLKNYSAISMTLISVKVRNEISGITTFI